MSDFFLVFDQITVWIGQALRSFTGHWLTTILLFLIVLNFIVSLLLIFRGGSR